ncbi:hypothetical protein FACS1894141_5830 [Spirochaetia bacterium]|nr:hypothetical protein FACS1894141_5830 [Spirochaetia bacterium]
MSQDAEVERTIETTSGMGLPIVLSTILMLVFLFVPFYILRVIAMFLVLVLLGSKAYSESLIRNVYLVRLDGDLREFRNEWVRVELAIENRGRLPALGVAITDSPGMLPVFRGNKAIHTLWGRSRTILTWQGYCSSRGIFHLGPSSFRCSDPLGLFPFTVTDMDTVKLFVYPATTYLGIKTPGGIPLGTLITSNILYEDVTRCRSLRDYQRGDEPRRINWKASARSVTRADSGGGNDTGLMVNEYEATLSYPLVIFLNLAPLEYSLRTRELYIERCIEAAAGVCLMATRERQELGLLLYSPPEPLSVINPGAFALIPILERLAAYVRPALTAEDAAKAQEDADSPELAGVCGSARAMIDRGKYLPYGTRFVYVGPELSEDDYVALNNLKRFHLSLEYLVIDERTLPAIAPGNSRRYQMKEGGYEVV